MRILAIEAEPRVLRNLTRALRDVEYAVDSSGDGPEGLNKACHFEYDAIVLDEMLPDMDGWEVLRRLRTLKKTPVLMLAAREDVEDRVKGLDTGVDDYLIKPYGLAELLARLRALIRRASGHAVSTIAAGEVMVDLRGQRVQLRGQAVPLTAREYSILELLALRRGTVVSRAMIHEHLFDETDDRLSNLIDVHVFSLRRKLGTEVIRTRRGQGYELPA